MFRPTVNRGPPGLISRDETFNSPVEPKSSLGIKVIPTVRFLSYNRSTCRFIARGKKGGLGYYEADQNNFKRAQLWIQLRTPFTKDSPLAIPNYKNCYGLWSKSKSNDFLEIKSRKSATDAFYPSDDSDAFVFAIDGFSYMYQKYSIPEMANCKVWECVQINESSKSIECVLKLQNNDQDESIIFRGKNKKLDPFDMSITLDTFEIPTASTRILKTTVDMNVGTMQTQCINDDPECLHFPYTVSIIGNGILQYPIKIYADGRVQYNATVLII